MDNKVDAFINKAKQWQPEFEHLRRLVNECGLTEELKWYQPCYTFNNSNVVIISGFKAYCALGFFKGALLQDTDKLLVQPTQNVQAGRQLRFTQVAQILTLEPIIKAYIYEAIEVEKAGLKIEFKAANQFAVPEEFKSTLASNPTLNTAFETLTPGRQKAYLLYFAAPKQAKTRQARIDKCIPQILSGKGLNDD